jgi:hypothetical protein
MKLQDIRDVLNFRSFRPEPDDSAASWPKRFTKERSLLLNVNNTGVGWACLEKGGGIGATGGLDGAFKEVVTQMVEEWRSLTEGGWCAVSVSTRYVISLEANLSRRNGSEEQIRTNPKAALGAKAERGKRYAVRHNPDSNSSVLLAVDEEMVKRVENGLKEVGLRVGRVACGTFAVLCDIIDQVGETRRAHQASNDGADMGPVVMIACCQGSVCALTQQGENWTELRSRTDLYEPGNLEPVLNIVLPLVENAGPGAQVVFAGDDQGSGFGELLRAKLPEVRVSDVTQENHLWKLLADL